ARPHRAGPAEAAFGAENTYLRRRTRAALRMPRASCGIVISAGHLAALLRDLAANLAALVRVGVDVDVPLAAHQIGRLGVGQVGRALERAAAGGDRHGDAGILAGLGRTMEMTSGRGPAEPGIVALPARLLGRGVEGDRHRSG